MKGTFIHLGWMKVPFIASDLDGVIRVVAWIKKGVALRRSD